ncbi:MAG: hypothetical protein P1V36_11970 [Planctomycetota bacterium]|nr:hypothetical protein [Planctomycetota bacterium]
MHRGGLALLFLLVWGGLLYVAFALPTQDKPARVPLAAEHEPELRGRPSALAREQAAHGAIPAEIRAAARRGQSPGARTRLVRWLVADPKRLDELVIAHAASIDLVELEPSRAAAAWGQALLEGIHGRIPAVVASLPDLLDAENRSETEQACLLGALLAVPQPHRVAPAALRALRDDQRLASWTRLAASDALLAAHGLEDEGLAWLRALARAQHAGDGGAIRRALRAPLVRSAEGVILHPALVDRLRFLDLPDWQEAGYLTRAMDPEVPHPAVHAFLLEAVAADATHVGFVYDTARAAFLLGPENEVLAWMETAPGPARAAGIRTLVARGVAHDRLQPHARAMLASTDPASLRAILALQGWCGIEAHDVLEQLRDHLDADDEGLRAEALRGLGSLADMPEFATTALVMVLEHTRAREARPRRAAAEALARFDQESSVVREAWVELLRDRDEQVVLAAVHALGRVLGTDADVRRIFEGLARGGTEVVRRTVRAYLRPRIRGMVDFEEDVADDR